jgi:hypothetical protein
LKTNGFSKFDPVVRLVGAIALDRFAVLAGDIRQRWGGNHENESAQSDHGTILARSAT